MGEKGLGAQSLYPEDLYNFWSVVRELHINLVGEVVHTLPREGMTS